MKSVQFAIKCLCVVFLWAIPVSTFALPAFPGAEGMGASTVGGRGGTVYVVDTLSDNPSDGVTFREACAASGARIVVFAVSGVINLTSVLNITNPNITIAGQTSPGGISTAGYTVTFYTHDVIVTHMRFRTGSHGQGVSTPDDVHAIRVRGDQSGTDIAYNLIFDHCSFGYGIDENVDVSYEVKNLVFSWCLIGRPLSNAGHSEGNHAMNMIIWGKANADEQTVSIHHNFFGTASQRSPLVNYYAFADERNNVAYNLYGYRAPNAESSNDSSYDSRAEYARVNWIANYYKRGPLSNATTYNLSVNADIAASATAYVSGNLGGSGVIRDEAGDPEWCVAAGSTYTAQSTDWQKETPHETSDIAVTTSTMSTAYADTIVAGAGATKPSRDSVDTAIALEYTNGTGGYTEDVTYPDDWPTYSTPSAPTDSDSDGMSDAWETSTFGGTSRDGTGDYDSDGYTDLEEYLFELGGYQEGAAQSASTTCTGCTGVGVTFN